MQRLFIMLFMITLCAPAFAQHVYKIKTDSLLVTNDSCNAEFILENETKFVNGFLYNKGKGRTIFKQAMIKLNDSIYLFGGDTLNFRSLLNTIGFSGTNIYNSNGTLTGNRMITLSSNTLDIAGSTTSRFFANGNVAIGTTTDAGYKLDVNGAFKSTTLHALNNNFYWGPGSGVPTGPLRIVRLTNWGTGSGIEIGALNTNLASFTTTPVIVGNSNSIADAESYIMGSGNSIGVNLNGYILGTNNAISNTSGHHILIGTGNISNGYTNGERPGIIIGQNNSTNGFGGGGIFGSYLKYYNNQQLLFGTNSPNTDLGISEVYFGYGVRLENDHTPSNLTINASGAFSGVNKSAPNITIAGGKGTGTGNGGDVLFSTSTALSSGSTLQSLNERMRIKFNTGNVLVGTSIDAGYKLDVNGTARIGGNMIINNTGYLNISSNNKIYIGGPSYGYNTFMSNAMPLPANEGYGNTYIGVVDNHNTPTGTMYNTIVGTLNNRSGVGGSNNVIVGSGNRNYLSPGNDIQNQTIIIGSGVYTSSAYNFNKVFYLGFDSPLSGNLNSVMSFAGSASSLENNSLTFGNSGPNGFQLDNIYFNSKQSDIGYSGRPIILNGAGGNGNNIDGGNLVIAGGRGTGTGTPGDFIISTSTTLSSGSTLQTLSNRWWVKGGTGFLGNTSSPTSSVDVTGTTGHSQFRLRISYTPTSTSDTNGNTGDFSWDDNYFYIKTSAGWKRSALSTF